MTNPNSLCCPHLKLRDGVADPPGYKMGKRMFEPRAKELKAAKQTKKPMTLSKWGNFMAEAGLVRNGNTVLC